MNWYNSIKYIFKLLLSKKSAKCILNIIFSKSQNEYPFSILCITVLWGLNLVVILSFCIYY